MCAQFSATPLEGLEFVNWVRLKWLILDAISHILPWSRQNPRVFIIVWGNTPCNTFNLQVSLVQLVATNSNYN